MLHSTLRDKNLQKVVLILALAAFAQSAYAVAMPWETGIQQFAASLCGPTAKAMGVLAFAIAGISIAIGEVKGWIHTVMMVLIGISIAILAPTILTGLGLGGGIVQC